MGIDRGLLKIWGTGANDRIGMPCLALALIHLADLSVLNTIERYLV
jgi:hypothetical protein